MHDKEYISKDPISIYEIMENMKQDEERNITSNRYRGRDSQKNVNHINENLEGTFLNGSLQNPYFTMFDCYAG